MCPILPLKEDNLPNSNKEGETGREIICYGKLILTFRDSNFVNIKPRVGSFVWIREGTVIPARHFPAHRHSGLRPAAQRHPEGEFSSWLKHNQHTSVTGRKVHGTSGVRRQAKQVRYKRKGILPVEICCLANKMSQGSLLCLQFTLRCQYCMFT